MEGVATSLWFVLSLRSFRDVVRQHHGYAYVGAVGVDAHQLVAGERTHLDLLAVEGVGG